MLWLQIVAAGGEWLVGKVGARISCGINRDMVWSWFTDVFLPRFDQHAGLACSLMRSSALRLLWIVERHLWELGLVDV